MLLIPMRALEHQITTQQLSDQNVQIIARQQPYGLFMSVNVSGVPIISNVVCRRNVLIVRDKYLGFLGDFAWIDKLGQNDPDYLGIGTRYFLIYYLPSELLVYQ